MTKRVTKMDSEKKRQETDDEASSKRVYSNSFAGMLRWAGALTIADVIMGICLQLERPYGDVAAFLGALAGFMVGFEFGIRLLRTRASRGEWLMLMASTGVVVGLEGMRARDDVLVHVGIGFVGLSLAPFLLLLLALIVMIAISFVETFFLE